MNAVKEPDDVVFARGQFRLGLSARLQILLNGRVFYESASPVDVDLSKPERPCVKIHGQGQAMLSTQWPWEPWLARRRARKDVQAPLAERPETPPPPVTIEGMRRIDAELRERSGIKRP